MSYEQAHETVGTYRIGEQQKLSRTCVFTEVARALTSRATKVWVWLKVLSKDWIACLSG